VTRPIVELVEGTTRRVDWPQLTFWHARVEGRDVILSLGIEPNLKWKTYTHQVVTFARDLGVTRIVTLGAFLADVAHTRDVPIVGTAPDAAEAERLSLTPSRYQGPTGIVGVLADLANRTGLPTVSLWAASPHYVSSSENPKAALALVEKVGAMLAVAIDVSDLMPAAQAWEDSIDEQVRHNEALVDYISGLEEADDELVAMEDTDGDDLAEEIQRFLEQRGGGDQ
jgi:predicted ATP-grasp superfamily ATP-dependent carboligase